MTLLTLHLAGYLSPSLNEWERLHPRAKTREKNRCAVYVGCAAFGRPQSPTLPFLDKVVCTYTRLRRKGSRGLDDDNLAGSFKPIGDALERAGVVENDRQIILVTRQKLVGMDGDWGTCLEFSAPVFCPTCGLPAPVGSLVDVKA